MSRRTPRTSLLTSGLEGLASTSTAVAAMLQELYALDDTLQVAHEQAKRDDEMGEHVVQAYEAFLASRARLLQELKRANVTVPWQMHMRIDDLELTLRQRKEKLQTSSMSTEPVGAARVDKSNTQKNTAPTSKQAADSGQEAAAVVDESEEEETTDPFLAFKAMILPSLFIGLIALIVYMVTDGRS